MDVHPQAVINKQSIYKYKTWNGIIKEEFTKHLVSN